MIGLTTIVLVIFTNYCDNVNYQYDFGWIEIAILAIVLFVNLSLVIFEGCNRIRLYCIYIYKRIKRCCTRKEQLSEDENHMKIVPIDIMAIEDPKPSLVTESEEPSSFTSSSSSSSQSTEGSIHYK